MAVFGASSLRRTGLNSDGSYNVYCYSCRDFIGKSMERIDRALCFICSRAEEGKPLDEESLRAYKLSKAQRVDVSALAVPEETDLSSILKKKRKSFSLLDIAGDMLRAIGRFRSTESATKEPSTLPSVQLAKSKRRGRLFDGVSLGSMEEVDKQASKDER